MLTEQIIDFIGRLLLRLAPVDFRDAWCDEIILTLVERCRAARRTGGRVRMLVAATLELADIGRSAMQARFSSLRRRDAAPFSPKPLRSKTMSDDLRHAVRRLRARPATSVAIVAMLALAIGVTTAMFTVVDALFLRPMPFRDAEHIRHVEMRNEHGGRTDVSPELFRAWRESAAFTAVEGVRTTTSVIDAGGVPIVLAAASVSSGLFDMLGVRPVRGRLFTPEEGRPGARDSVLISEDVWRTVFAANPNILGVRVNLDRESVVIVGILPKAFRFPTWNTRMWRPFDFLAQSTTPVQRPTAYVRLSSTTPEADALRLATAAAHAIDSKTTGEWAAANDGRYAFQQYYRSAVGLLTGAVVLVFLVLCANASSLLLGRFSARRREFTLCSALGASRQRLLTQSVIESSLLGAWGAALGVVVAWGLVSIARVLLPLDLLTRTLNPIDLDVRAVAVATAGGALATMGAGWIPAWLGTKFDHAVSLRTIERSGTESPEVRLLTRGFLVTQVALACTLLVSAALLVRSFLNVTHVDLGFDPRGIVAVNVSLDRAIVPDADARAAAMDQASAELRRLPGVQALVWSRGVPLAGGADMYFGGVRPDGPDAVTQEMNISGYSAGSEFFQLYGIRILKGRSFEDGEDKSSVILGAHVASTFWPGSSPINKTISFGKNRYRVVGIVNDIRRPIEDGEIDFAELYWPLGRRLTGSYAVASLRCDGACPSEGLIRQRLGATVAGLDVYGVDRLDEIASQDLAQPRAMATLALTFASIALVAAAAGLFSILSQAVARRRREFGVRAAIGASPGQIRGLVLREGAGVAGGGIVLGSILAWFVMRTAASVQFGVTAADPTSWIVVLVVLVAAIAAAASRPALDAGRVNPVELLRDE